MYHNQAFCTVIVAGEREKGSAGVGGDGGGGVLSLGRGYGTQRHDTGQ